MAEMTLVSFRLKTRELSFTYIHLKEESQLLHLKTWFDIRPKPKWIRKFAIFGLWRLLIWENGAKNKKSNRYQVTYIFFRFFSHVFQAWGNFEISAPLKNIMDFFKEKWIYHTSSLFKNLAIISLKLGLKHNKTPLVSLIYLHRLGR